MSKRIITAVCCLIIPLALGAQSVPALDDIDFTAAQVSQAGPESFYVRNVGLPDGTVSLTITLAADGSWQITDVTPETQNVIPDGLILDFATIEPTGVDTLKLDWIIYDGSILSGVLSLSGADITAPTTFGSRAFPAETASYPKPLTNLLTDTGTGTSGEALATLQKKYDTAVSENQALSEQVSTLKAEKAALDKLKSKLEADNASLQSMIDALKSEATASSAETPTVSAPEAVVQSYIDKLDALKQAIASLQTDISSLESNLSEEMLSAAATISASLSADIDKAESSIRQSLSVAPSDGEDQSARISSLEDRIAKLTAENAVLTEKMATLESELRSSFLKNGFIETLRPTLTKTLISSFVPSEAQLGVWYVGEKSARQLEKSMLFGKLLLPLTQGEKPVLYSFKARSTDPANEWVGLGLHIFVENVDKRGYGLGDSLLVWLTRDQEVYKNNFTYLQLYRSDDDVNMDRVMDAVIQEPVTEFLTIEVLYQPVEQYITISVGGEEKIRYKTWFGIDEGVQVALRTLGTAEFTDLRVSTTP